ncbi:MAG: bifunctional riboflavin kinase/FAD synthetase [Verrucomicrobia bacterium]|nr:bifunctional riboflavin kinase/FAD synthetase [Verrucomicrobiota bacterium]
MQVVHDFSELRPFASKTCLAIGVFDGVHRGHQAVIGAAIADAQTCGGLAAAVTFDPHPARVLAPERAPLLLTSTAHKLAMVRSLGVPVCVVIKFDRAFAGTTAEDFLQRVAEGAPGLQAICVGSGFRFGKGRAGTVALMREFSKKRGFRLHELSSVTLGGAVISSTAVRQAVASGDLAKAEAMLGRPFSILGTVVRGDGRGRTLGYPTANLNRHNEVLPPNGVYAVRAALGGALRPGLLNIGLRPTVHKAQAGPLAELHVLDFSGELYGSDIEVFFVARLRAERKFSSLEELRAQIVRDEEAARRVLA